MASEPPIKVMARAAEPAMASEGTPDESLAKEISFDDEAEVSINRSPISSNTSQRSQDVDITPIVCILDPKQNLPAVQATGHSKGKDTLETVWDHGLPPNPDFDPIPYINNFPAGLSGPFNYIAPTHAHLGSRDQLRAHIDPPGLIIPNPPVTTTEATLRPTIVTIAALLIANHGLFVTHTIPWLQITLLRNGCPTKLEPIQMV
ncbi:hypothetical protein DFS34DRAFT_676054 [Phlyctochytrium arcticum]|nr:hypothetical protein DFS34DRAFT_676054 [Phlyctochytrium arcticum]